MLKYYLVLLVMTILGAIASLLLKRASDTGEFTAMFKEPTLYAGGVLYLLSSILNIYILKFLDYSVVLPLTAFTYVWTFLISYLVLKESISKKKIVGIICVLLGAIIIASA